MPRDVLTIPLHTDQHIQTTDEEPNFPTKSPSSLKKVKGGAINMYVMEKLAEKTKRTRYRYFHGSVEGSRREPRRHTSIGIQTVYKLKAGSEARPAALDSDR